MTSDLGGEPGNRRRSRLQRDGGPPVDLAPLDRVEKAPSPSASRPWVNSSPCPSMPVHEVVRVSRPARHAASSASPAVDPSTSATWPTSSVSTGGRSSAATWTTRRAGFGS
ncbi:hypothetical protein BCD48_14085 [Pseudofrankia sp. BMG5.36]|nr:hypothetical protein BCD48_14085 [Pseudofrankia sp. BMG5.36]